MIHVGVGHSADSSTKKAVEQAFASAFAHAGVIRADLAFVVFTAEHIRDQEKLPNAVTRAAGTARVVGSSAAGILTGEGELEGSHAVAVLVLSSDRLQADAFLFESLRGRDDQVAAEIARISRTHLAKNLHTVLMPDSYNG